MTTKQTDESNIGDWKTTFKSYDWIKNNMLNLAICSIKNENIKGDLLNYLTHSINMHEQEIKKWIVTGIMLDKRLRSNKSNKISKDIINDDIKRAGLFISQREDIKFEKTKIEKIIVQSIKKLTKGV